MAPRNPAQREAMIASEVRLSESAQSELERQKRSQRINNELYFRVHPELRQMLAAFVSTLAANKPDDVHLCACARRSTRARVEARTRVRHRTRTRVVRGGCVAAGARLMCLLADRFFALATRVVSGEHGRAVRCPSAASRDRRSAV